MGQENVTGIGS